MNVFNIVREENTKEKTKKVLLTEEIRDGLRIIHSKKIGTEQQGKQH